MVEIRSFGKCELGRVDAVTLSAERLRVTVLTYGVTVQRILTPDKSGVWRDVCLGYDTLEEYRKNPGYFGACVGRNCNRIGGASAVIAGNEYRLTANEGKNQLHGGLHGFNSTIWACEAEGERAVFTARFPDGLDGFPGNLAVQITCSIENGSDLRLDYEARSDRDTIANFTNHTYFNLNGAGSGTIETHALRLDADRYTPSDPENIPTGELRSVAGTCFDFRAGKPLGRELYDPLLSGTHGYDHNLCLNGAGLRRVGELFAPESGISLSMETTQPGLQLYTANWVAEGLPGKDGRRYGPHGAVCLEAQVYPDAPHHEQFPSSILKAGDTARQTTIYRFSNKEE